MYGQVHLGLAENVVYGDVNGDGQAEAALNVGCDNGGGTAGSEIVDAFIILTGAGGRLQVMGTLTPQKRPLDERAVKLGMVKIGIGRVVAYETYYRPSDGNCCASGEATTEWTLKEGQLVPGLPLVVS